MPCSTKVKSLSHVRLFVTPWTVAYQAPPSMEFSRQEYWSGLPFPSPEDLPNSGTEPGFPALQTGALLSEPPGKPLCPAARLKKKKKGQSVYLFYFFFFQGFHCCGPSSIPGPGTEIPQAVWCSPQINTFKK